MPGPVIMEVENPWQIELDDREWVEELRPEIANIYQNKYVAVYNQEIISTSPKPYKLQITKDELGRVSATIEWFGPDPEPGFNLITPL